MMHLALAIPVSTLRFQRVALADMLRLVRGLLPLPMHSTARQVK